MEQLTYGNSSVSMVLEFPSDWDVASITGVNIGLDSTDGTELIAETAATLTSGALAASVTAKSMTITVDGVIGEIRRGGRLRLQEKTAADAEAVEDVIVSSFTVDTGTYTITLEEETRFAHSDDTDVTGCYATYDADMSDTDTFTSGLQVRAIWTPVGSDDTPYTELYEVGSVGFGVSDLWGQFQVVYANEWRRISGEGNARLDKREHLYSSMFDGELSLRGIYINRIVDQKILEVGMLKFCRKMILEDSGDDDAHEFTIAREEWYRWIDTLSTHSALWEDRDQDGINDDGEETAHGFEVMERYI